jgi:serine/threonine protein kinase
MQVNSRYTILSKLGTGGMSEIYLARDSALVRTVALKILPLEGSADPKTIRRFKQDAKLASAFNHPNVLAIHEVGETDDGQPFVAMEHVEGQGLDALLKGKPLGVEQVVNIGSQIADALAEAHARGMILRDIKPANIMLTPRGQVKLLDFGLAKLATTSRGKSRAQPDLQLEPTAGPSTSTVRFMSPEQALGQRLDHRTDILAWVFSCMKWPLVVLRPPATPRKPLTKSLHKPSAMSNNQPSSSRAAAHCDPVPERIESNVMVR